MQAQHFTWPRCLADTGVMSRHSPRARALRRIACAGAAALLSGPLLLAPSAGAATTPTAPAAPLVPPTTAPAPVAASGTLQQGAYVPPLTTIVAAAARKLTPVYDRIGAAKPITTLDNKTNFSGRHVFLVLAREGDWYKVELPMRPNGRTGYVKAADVQLYQHDYAIHVSLGGHTMVVYKAGKEIMRETVAVGSAKYPTPVGSYFLRELARPGNPRGAYGPYAFGLSAYSNVLQKFGRGDGQIGVHGTNAPGQLGLSVSHGCIRVRNAAIVLLAKTLPQGVPIDIAA